MNKSVWLSATAVLVSVTWASSATAAPPAWCKGEKTDFNGEDVHTLQSGDPEAVLKTLAEAQCATGSDVDAHRAEIQKAVQSYGPKYGLKDADWADVLAWDKDPSYTIHPDYSGTTIAQMTPIDQFVAIQTKFELPKSGGAEQADPMYVTDILDAGGHLTEVGRLGFLEWCTYSSDDSYDDDDSVKFAVCADDMAKWDVNKFYDQLRGDTTHDAVARMVIRMKGHNMAAKLKDVADFKAKLVKKDDEYGKIWDAAAKGRADWAKGVGSDKKLLELVEQVESGALFHSRKQLEGCEKKTADALAAAVAKIPAKSFSGMHDVRDDPFHGFALKAADVLAKNPAVTVIAAAYIQCQPTRAWSNFLAYALRGAPGARGPRNAGLDAVMTSTFKFDDTNKKGLDYPDISQRPYKQTGGDAGSAGGVVAKVKPEGDHLSVALEKTFVMQEDCVKEHSGRATRLVFSGNSASVEYESICDKTAMVKHDMTWADFKVAKTSQQWLKPGVLFSAPYGSSKPDDILATWPSKTAKLPSMLLGATLK